MPVSSVDMNEFRMCDNSQCLLLYVAIVGISDPMLGRYETNTIYWYGFSFDFPLASVNDKIKRKIIAQLLQNK